MIGSNGDLQLCITVDGNIFNRSVQEHATVAFKGLKNVECRTFHSLAYCVR